MSFIFFSAIFFKPFLRNKIDPMPLSVGYTYMTELTLDLSFADVKFNVL
jgi:hypothetical protein